MNNYYNRTINRKQLLLTARKDREASIEWIESRCNWLNPEPLPKDTIYHYTAFWDAYKPHTEKRGIKDAKRTIKARDHRTSD